MGYALVPWSPSIRWKGSYQRYPIGGGARIVGVRIVKGRPESFVTTIDNDYLQCTEWARFRLEMTERFSKFDPYAPGFAPWDVSRQRSQLPTLPARSGLHLLNCLLAKEPSEPVVLSVDHPRQPRFSQPPRSGLGVGRNPTSRRLG